MMKVTLCDNFLRMVGMAAVVLVVMPAHAVVVSYVAAPSYSQTATILNTGVSDSATGDPPADVSATYSPGFEGAASGTASASVSTLEQSIDGFHIAGSLSGTSTGGASSSLTSNAAVTGGYYEFSVARATAAASTCFPPCWMVARTCWISMHPTA